MAKYGTSSYYEDLYAGRSTKSTPVKPKFGTSSWEARYGKVTKYYGKTYTAKTASGEDIKIKKYTPGYFAKRAGQRPSVYISPSKERYGISKPKPVAQTLSTPTPSKTSLQQIAREKQPYKTIYTRGEEVRVSPKVYDKWVAGQRKDTAKRIVGEVIFTAGHPGYIPNVIEPIYERTLGQRLRKYTYKKIPKSEITKRESKVVPDVYYAKRPSGEIIEIPKQTKEGFLKTKVIEPKKGGLIEGFTGKVLKYTREKPSGLLAIGTEIAVTAGATSLASAPKRAVPKAFKNLARVKAKPAKVEPSLIKRPVSADGLVKFEPVVKGKQDITFFFKKPKRFFGLIKPKTTIKKGSVTVPLQEIGVLQKGKSYSLAEKSIWTQVRMRPGTSGKSRIVQASKVDIASIGGEIAPKKQLYFTGLKSQKMFDVSKKGYKLAKEPVKTRYLMGTSQEVTSIKSPLGAFEMKGGVFKTQRVFKTSGRFAKKPSTGIYKQTEFLWKSPKEVPKRIIKEPTKTPTSLLKEAQRANIKSFRLTKPFKTKPVSHFPKAGKGTKTELVAKPISQLRAESTAKTQVKLILEEETARVGSYARGYSPAKTLVAVSTPRLIPKESVKRSVIVKAPSVSISKTQAKAQTKILTPSKKTILQPASAITSMRAVTLFPSQTITPGEKQDTLTRPKTTVLPGTPISPIPKYDFGFRPPPTSTPPLFPPFWFTPRLKGAKLRKPKRGRKKYKYQPSLSAIFLGVKGLKPKKKRIFTGLEVRPLIKKKKRKKKGRKR